MILRFLNKMGVSCYQMVLGACPRGNQMDRAQTRVEVDLLDSHEVRAGVRAHEDVATSRREPSELRPANEDFERSQRYSYITISANITF